MNIVAFSYNRALQLHAFLSSLVKHLRVDKYEVNVIYNSGGGDYEVAYEQVKKDFPTMNFIRRKKIESLPIKYFLTYKKNLYRHFKHKNIRQKLTNFKELLEKTVEESKYEPVAFFTDDSLFCRDVHIDTKILDEIANDKSGRTVYSLRHGLNLDPKPSSIEPYGENLIWNVTPSSSELAHWTYLFSIDGHVYQRKLLLPAFKKLNFSNPNSFEGFVNNYVETEMSNVCNRLIFSKHNSLVGFELNRVQDFAVNNSLNFSVGDLNKKFLEGYRLRYLYDEENITNFRPDLKGIEFSKENTEVKETIIF
jgi:hypothetical protein